MSGFIYSKILAEEWGIADYPGERIKKLRDAVKKKLEELPEDERKQALFYEGIYSKGHYSFRIRVVAYLPKNYRLDLD